MRRYLLGLLTVPLLLGCGAAPATISPDRPVDRFTEGGCVHMPPPASGNSGESHAQAAVHLPHFRGIDLIAGSEEPVQRIRGELHYGLFDQALEHETVDLLVCRAGAWEGLGRATTNADGEFELRLQGGVRLLPGGLHQLYASVPGKRSGTEFLALVVPAGSHLVVTDVDGTLTEREDAFNPYRDESPVVAHQEAAHALRTLRERGYWPVYVTARSRLFTGATRSWLLEHNFPPGPLRLAPTWFTLPGKDTLKYKTQTMKDIQAAGLEISIGIGNRASDAEAYRDIGVRPSRIFLKRTEYSREISRLMKTWTERAVCFDDYGALLPELRSLSPTESSPASTVVSKC